MGGLLTIAIVFPIFSGNRFWGDKAMMEEDKVVMEFSSVPHQGKP